MPKLNKATVLKYLKANGTNKKQDGNYLDFYLSGCSGRTDFWLKDVPHIRFCQEHYTGGYDWRAYSDKATRQSYICTVGVFDVIAAHQNGEDIDQAYDAAELKAFQGLVDYIRPGAPGDYGP